MDKVKAFSDGRKKASLISVSLADALRQCISEGTVVCSVPQKCQLWNFIIPDERRKKKFQRPQSSDTSSDTDRDSASFLPPIDEMSEGKPARSRERFVQAQGDLKLPARDGASQESFVEA